MKGRQSHLPVKFPQIFLREVETKVLGSSLKLPSLSLSFHKYMRPRMRAVDKNKD